jgi:hypothetical protein
MSPTSIEQPTVVGQRTSAIHFIFGFLTVAAAAALIRGHLGAETNGSRLAVDIIFGGALIAFVAAWVYIIRRPIRLEVRAATITLLARNGSQSGQLSRNDGDLYLHMTGSAKTRSWNLCATQSTTRLSLPTFHPHDVVAACTAKSWPWAAEGQHSRFLR